MTRKQNEKAAEESKLVDPTVEHVAMPADANDASTVDHLSETKDTGPAASDQVRDLPDLAGYEVHRELARGGMGRVLAGREISLDREIALKILLTQDGSGASRFLAESRITAKLPHPGIPPVYAIGELADGSPFLAMKLVRGKDLNALLRRRESARQDLARWIAVFEKICQAVGYAHSQSVIHRDLKPANVMVGAFGEVYVMDWGLAKDLDDNSYSLGELAPESHQSSYDHPVETLAGTVMGTPTYMPPEQALGRTVDARADVFSLGGILCFILTGEPPFNGRTARDIVQKAASGDVSDVFALLERCGADRELVQIAKKCLSPNAENRPDDANALSSLIADYRAGLEERVRRAESEKAAADVRVAEQRKRRRLMLKAVTVTICVLVAGIVGTSVGLFRTNNALHELKQEQTKTADALVAVTQQQQRAESALKDLTDSRIRNVQNLRTVTDRLVEDRLGRNDEVTEADRMFINGLLPMWEEIAVAHGVGARGQVLQAEGYYRVGRLQEWLGQRGDAEKSLRRSLDLRGQLVADAPDQPAFRQELATTHNSLAILLRDLGNTDEAEANYVLAIEVVRDLIEDYPENLSYQQDLAGWFNNLGRFMQRLGRKEDAIEYLRQSLAKREELAESHPKDAGFQRDLAESHNNLGILLIQFQDFIGAQAAFDQALLVRQNLVDQYPEDTEFRLLLANTFNNLGVLAYNLRDYQSAEDNLVRAAEVKLQLAEDYPAAPKYRRDLSTTYINLAGVLTEAQKFDEAVEMGALAVLQAETLVEEFSDVPDYRRDLASAYINLGSLHQASQEFDEAERCFEAASDLTQKLSGEFPEVVDYHDGYARTLFNLGLLYGAWHSKVGESQRDFEAMALSSLRRAVDAGWTDANQLATNPSLETVRDNEVFRALLQQLEANQHGSEGRGEN